MNAQAVLDFIEEVGVLKNIQRAGWRVRGIKEAESVADHCYRLSLLAMALADVLIESGVDLDVEKVMRLALLHEIGEARIGDIPGPAMRHITPRTKAAAERDAVNTMTAPLGSLGRRYAQLWEEFESGGSLEAKLVRAADKLEMMVQALAYEKVGYRGLEDFWNHARAGRYGFEEFETISAIMALLFERRETLAK